MPAPAPVAADTIKLTPANPKLNTDAASRAPRSPKSRGDECDAHRFDDALREARARPRQAKEAREPAAAPKALSAPTSASSKASKQRDEASGPPATPEQASDVQPDQLAATDAEPAQPTSAERPAAEQPVIPSGGSVVVVDEVVAAAVVVAPQAPPVVVDVEEAPDKAVELPAAEIETPVRFAAKLARVSSPQQTAPPAPSIEGATAEAEAGATVEPSLVEAAPPQAEASPTEAQPDVEAPAIHATAHRAPQKPMAAANPSAAVKVEGAATTNTADVEGDLDSGGDGATPQDQPQGQTAAGRVEPNDPTVAKPTPAAPAHAAAGAPSDAVDALAADGRPAPAAPKELTPSPASAAPAAPTAREVEFAQANHDRLVTAMRAQLLPRGGTMQIRLDPPELGSLQVAVRMLDGVMSVSFQTSTDEATQLLSHSLTQLKHVLESQGVAVDKLHVQQAQRSEPSSSNSNDEQQQHRHGAHGDENLARQEQQRREMLRRMWRRLALGSDPLDLVA